MIKELKELTEEHARRICSIVGKEFVSFRCEETGEKIKKFYCDIFFKDKNSLRIFDSGIIILIDQGYKPLPSVNWSAIDIVDYLRSEGFYIVNKFEKKATIEHEDRLEIIKSHFKNISDEKLAEFTEIAKKYSDVGLTVQEYFSDLSGNYPISNLSKLTSGKICPTVDMVFSRERFHGIKVIDSPDLNFNLIEVVEATKHPLKQVKEGIRVYRVEAGNGSFTIIRQDSSFEQIEVGSGDTILIKAGDCYKYKGRQLKLFEVNIKYP